MPPHRPKTEGRAPLWDIAIDRGGTFTDIVAASQAGRTIHRKVLSGEGQEALAIGRLLADEGGELAELRIGTTVATNALLTGVGPEVGLLITEGMQDCLLIGDQRRPDGKAPSGIGKTSRHAGGGVQAKDGAAG